VAPVGLAFHTSDAASCRRAGCVHAPCSPQCVRAGPAVPAGLTLFICAMGSRQCGQKRARRRPQALHFGRASRRITIAQPLPPPAQDEPRSMERAQAACRDAVPVRCTRSWYGAARPRVSSGEPSCASAPAYLLGLAWSPGRGSGGTGQVRRCRQFLRAASEVLSLPPCERCSPLTSCRCDHARRRHQGVRRGTQC